MNLIKSSIKNSSIKNAIYLIKFLKTSCIAGFALSILIASPCLTRCVPAVIAGGATAAGSSQSPLPLGTQVEDMTIKTKAIGILNNMPALSHNTNVEIVVFNRILLILGQVPTETLKNQIAEKMSEINRVRIVYNQLTIGTPTTLSQYAKDSWITAQIGAAFIGKVNPMQFKIVTENGVVYLIALTDQTDGEIASKIASQIKGVQQVIEAYSYISDESSDSDSSNSNSGSATQNTLS